MKRILFLMRYPITENYNLKPKFDGQMKACVNLGYSVDYIAYDGRFYYLCSVNSGQQKKIGKKHFHTLSNYRSTVAFFDLYLVLGRILKTEYYDYIYMRHKIVVPKTIKAMKRFKASGGKLVVEIPSYGVKENSLSRSRSLLIRFTKRSEERFNQLVDLYTLIGDSCPNTYKSRPAIEIENGISIDVLPQKRDVSFRSEIHMIALASMRDWQGYDRVVKGISQYSGDEKLILHFVGQDFDGAVQRWLALAHELGIEDCVIDHGALYDDSLSKVFDQCNLGIGSMGLHRKGVTTAATLKVREYAARGIPFIYGYRDTSLNGNESFAVRLPADDSAVNFNNIIPWLRSLEKHEQLSTEIRQYAKTHLSWEKQMAKAFSILEDI